MKTLLLIIWPWKLMPHDLERLGISEYEKFFDIEIHDMGKFINKKYFKTFKNENIKLNYKIIRFSNFFIWLKRVIKIRRKYNNRKIVVINILPNNGFKYFFVSIFLFLINCICIRFDQPGVPISKIYKNKSPNNRKDFILFFNSILRLLNTNLKKVTFAIQTTLISIIGRGNLYILTGNARIKSAKKIYPFSKFIVGNSYDYNKFLINKKNNKLKRKVPQKYCVYVDSVAPLVKGDEIFVKNQKLSITKKKWYTQLNSFFDIVEELTGLCVVIAGHPKTKGFNLDKYFNQREVIYDDTEALIKYSNFVITRNSSAYSYAIAHKKPLMFVLTKELLNDLPFMETASALWQALNIEPTRIDLNNKIYQSLKNLDFDSDVYKKFRDLYLGNPKYLTNQELIINTFKNLSQF